MKNIKGITLVALVITIIILLILAGVSIAQLTGNGLFEKAKIAKEESKNAQDLENAILEDYEKKIIGNEIIENNRDSVTVSKEEYEELKNKVNNMDANINRYEIQTGSTGALSAAGHNEPTCTITLPKEMKDTNYMISIDINRWGSGWANIQYRIANVTTTSFQIITFNNYDSTANFGYRWSVIGELKGE